MSICNMYVLLDDKQQTEAIYSKLGHTLFYINLPWNIMLIIIIRLNRKVNYARSVKLSMQIVACINTVPVVRFLAHYSHNIDTCDYLHL